jgi:hypothetical protein
MRVVEAEAAEARGLSGDLASVLLDAGHAGPISGLAVLPPPAAAAAAATPAAASPSSSAPLVASAGSSDSRVIATDLTTRATAFAARSLHAPPHAGDALTGVDSSRDPHGAGGVSADGVPVGCTCMVAAPAVIDPSLNTIAAGYADGTLRVFTRGTVTAAWHRVFTAKPHTAEVTSIAFTAGGAALLATGSADGTVFLFAAHRIEEVEGGSSAAAHAPSTATTAAHCFYPLGFVTLPAVPAHDGSAAAAGSAPLSAAVLAWGPGDRCLAVGCSDGTLRSVFLPPEAESSAAASSAPDHPQVARWQDARSGTGSYGLTLPMAVHRPKVQVRRIAPPKPVVTEGKDGRKSAAAASAGGAALAAGLASPEGKAAEGGDGDAAAMAAAGPTYIISDGDVGSISALLVLPNVVSWAGLAGPGVSKAAAAAAVPSPHMAVLLGCTGLGGHQVLTLLIPADPPPATIAATQEPVRTTSPPTSPPRSPVAMAALSPVGGGDRSPSPSRRVAAAAATGAEPATPAGLPSQAQLLPAAALVEPCGAFTVAPLRVGEGVRQTFVTSLGVSTVPAGVAAAAGTRVLLVGLSDGCVHVRALLAPEDMAQKVAAEEKAAAASGAVDWSAMRRPGKGGSAAVDPLSLVPVIASGVRLHLHDSVAAASPSVVKSGSGPVVAQRGGASEAAALRRRIGGVADASLTAATTKTHGSSSALPTPAHSTLLVTAGASYPFLSLPLRIYCSLHLSTDDHLPLPFCWQAAMASLFRRTLTWRES